jgi:hypothetical protein
VRYGGSSLWPLAQLLCYRFDAGSYCVALIGGMAIAGREKRGGSVRQTFLGISQVTNGASLGDAVKRLRAPHLEGHGLCGRGALSFSYLETEVIESLRNE